MRLLLNFCRVPKSKHSPCQYLKKPSQNIRDIFMIDLLLAAVKSKLPLCNRNARLVPAVIKLAFSVSIFFK